MSDMSSDRLTEPDLRARLGLHNRPAQRPLRYFDSIDSTMDEAQRWLFTASDPQTLHGAVVIADEQRRGRGRLGRVWHTPPGVALALSVILIPPPDALHQVTMLGALAICDLLDGLSADSLPTAHRPQTGIKWANDVLLNGRKVSGILSEALWSHDDDRLLGVVLGMGVNVRVAFDDPALSAKATSIEPEYGQIFQRADLLARLLHHLDGWAAQLGSARLFEVWHRRLVTLGQRVTITLPDGAVSGVAEAVEPSGALWIRMDDSTRQRIIAGDLDMGIPSA